MTRRPPRALAAALALAAATCLTACAPLFFGGAMVGGGMVATDRRTSGIQLEDEGIELKANKRLSERLGDRGHVAIVSYNRQVLIAGEVASEADRVAAAQIVGGIENVRTTINELAVMGNSSLTSRSNDALLTTKVKSTYLDAKDVFSNAIKVYTERGTVYLMGRLTEREAERATSLASSISGVQKVVKLFEIITEAELAEVQPKPAPKSTGEPRN